MSTTVIKAKTITARTFLAPRVFLAAVAGVVLLLLSTPTTRAEQAVVKLWNWSIHDKKYQQKMYKLFNERNPEIKIDYSSIASTMYDQVLEAAFTAKEPPDIFMPSGKLTFSALRTKELIMPLNECASNAAELKAWMDRYPPFRHQFIEGVSMFGGKVYTVTMIGGENWYFPYSLYYNRTLWKDAGIGKPPATQGEMRQAAAKVTSAGQGKSFGIVTGLRSPCTWQMNVGLSLAWYAGARGTGGEVWGADKKDGRYHASGPQFINALKLWIGMRQDGSVFPAESTFEDEQAKMAFATNKAAMIFGGDWVVANTLAYNPDCDFDVMLPPTPDDGVRRGYIYIDPIGGGGGGYVVSRATRNPRAVWKVIDFLTSLEYQEGWVKGGYGVSFMPEANKPENFLNPQMYKFVEWGMDPNLRRITPNYSQEAWRVFDYYSGVYPTYHDVVTNVYMGTSGFEALKALDDSFDAALDTAITKAQEAGVKVSRKDFAFPDWDPTKDWDVDRK